MFGLIAAIAIAGPFSVSAQLLEEDVHVEITFAPRTGTFTEGSEFDVPVYLNTEGQTVGVVDLTIKFDPELVAVVRPSGGKSMFDHWLETPVYDNEKGTVTLKGEVTSGIVTDSGLITTISFKALGTGEAVITMSPEGGVFLYEGLKSPLKTTFGRAEYSIVKKPSDGVRVFSETHASSNRWYNNKSPVLSWEAQPEYSGYSFAIDDIPSTIPDNEVDSTGVTVSYNDLKDGVWYFHIKAKKGEAWQSTSHYLLKIDTVPPVAFTPTVNSLAAAVISRSVISFRTYDNLSGLDRYEVGVIDAEAAASEKPVFFESESPYSLPDDASDTVQVVVRAFDKAGNVQEGAININSQFRAGLLVGQYGVPVLGTLLGLLALFMTYHYVFRHRMAHREYAMDGTYGPQGTFSVQDAVLVQRPRVRESVVVQAPPQVAQIEERKSVSSPVQEEKLAAVPVPPPASSEPSPIEYQKPQPTYVEYSLKRPANMPQKFARMPAAGAARASVSVPSNQYEPLEPVHFPDPVLPKYQTPPAAPSHDDPSQWPPNRVG